MNITEEKFTKIETNNGSFTVELPLVLTQNLTNLMITGLAHMRYALSLEEMAIMVGQTFGITRPHTYWLAEDLMRAADYITQQNRGG